MASTLALLRHIDDLLLGALSLARARKARLLAISVEVPTGDVRALVLERLALLGHPEIEVRTTFSQGAIRLLTVEYGR
jgi:hypothetical protein